MPWPGKRWCALAALACAVACWPPLDDLAHSPSARDGGAADTAVTTYRGVVLADTPVAYWRLEESAGPTAHDETGNHHDAQYASSGITFHEPGAFATGGYGVTLDGKSGRIVVGNLFDFAGRAPFAVEAWIRPTVIDQEFRRVFQKEVEAPGGPTDGYGLDVDDRADGLGFHRTANGVSQVDLGLVPPPPKSVFTHIVVSCDGTTVRLFVNGAEVAKSRLTGDAVTTPAPFMWGVAGGGGGFFGGELDELAVYDKDLVETRVSAHYLAGKGGP